MIVYSVLLVAIMGAHVSSFRFGRLVSSNTMGWRRLATTMSEPVVDEEASTKQTPTKLKADFSSFAVGQEYDGTVISAKNFGVFVDIATGFNVLVPRSFLSMSSFEKLKQMASSKSADKIKVEITGMSAENQTLSGKYIQAKGKERADISHLGDIKSKMFNATVVSAHDFGLFAEIDELNVEGLVPASRLPDDVSVASIKKSYPVGTKIVVQVQEVNAEAKRLVLSMKLSTRPGVDAFSGIPQTKWFQSIVQSVSSFGLFVRPAGFDSVGLIHNSRIPRDLIAALKKRAPVAPGTNKTDVEALFSEGDVVKSRVHAVDVGSRRLELSMLPMRNTEEDDDYIVPGRDPEDEEDRQMDNQDDEEEYFDAEETLLWWKGSPYSKIISSVDVALDEEVEIVKESSAVIEGTWRRMFEVDLREDENEFSSKVLEQEMAELAEEIGELEGLDDDLSDSLGFGLPYVPSVVGRQVTKTALSAWGDEITFFKEFEATETSTVAALKGGKKAEQLEFERLLKEAEQELEQSARRPRGDSRVEAEVPTESPLVVNDSSSALETSEASSPEPVSEADPVESAPAADQP